MLHRKLDGKSDVKLSVFCDVSCDTTNPNNPFPVYDQFTTLDDPVLTVRSDDGKHELLDVIAIDHLPSLTPVDSSEGFGADLLPHFVEFVKGGARGTSPVFARAGRLFEDKVAEMKKTEFWAKNGAASAGATGAGAVAGKSEEKKE